MSGENEFNGFQINPGSIGSDWVFGATGTAPQGTKNRAPGSKLSNFNAMYMGQRRSDDYTRTTFTTDVEENNKPVIGIGFGTDRSVYNYNPLVWGSTVKRVYDDQMHKMGMSTSVGQTLTQPGFDVSDEKESDASGMVSFKNYPSEGYSSFGKKGDKEIAWAGNSWIRMPV